MQKLKDIKLASGQTTYIAKKGKKYITERNGELALSTVQAEALCHPDGHKLEQSLLNLGIDSRNARVLGNSFGVLPITAR